MYTYSSKSVSGVGVMVVHDSVVSILCLMLFSVTLLWRPPCAGHSHCVRVSPAMASRMVDSTRRVLNSYLPDVYIYTDVVRGKEGGRSVMECGWEAWLV